MSGETRIACAFVGLLDDEGRVAQNTAYSPAGTHFQESLVSALRDTAVDVSHIYALRPVASYPVSSRLAFGTRRTRLAGSISTTLLPFVNLGALKTLTSGITLLPSLLMWTWRERKRTRVFLLYNLYSPPGIFSILAGWLSRTRVVAIVADIQVPGQGLLPDTLLRRLDYRLQTKTLKRFDGLVVLTRTMADEFAPDTPRIEMEGAVPEILIPPPPEASPKSDDDPFTVMYSGGLSELKGVPLLLSAFSLLEGNPYTLLITGRGPLESMVRAAAGKDPRIKYLGFPATEELLALYSHADVLVLPHSSSHTSARYLFPSKLIEYLATGTPVISTCSTPGVAEHYGGVAIVMETGSAEDLARQISRLAGISHRERRALGALGRAFVLQEKTWRRQAQRIADFIVDITTGQQAAESYRGSGVTTPS